MPLLVIMDGAPGLVKAVKRVWPHAYRQRCQVHRMRNILAKVPRLMQATMKKLVQQVFLAPTYAKARQRGRDLITKFKDRYPAAMDCLERDLEECLTYWRFPEEHHESSPFVVENSVATSGLRRRLLHLHLTSQRFSQQRKGPVVPDATEPWFEI